MSVIRFMLWVALVGMIGAVALTGDAAAQERKRRAADATVVMGTLGAVDADKNTVTVTVHKMDRATGEASDTHTTYPLAKDAKVLQDDAAAKLGDLKKGFPVTVKLDGATAASVSVDGGSVQGEFFSANLDRNTVKVIAGRNAETRVYHQDRKSTRLNS